MKRILYFLGLKVLEIGGVGLIMFGFKPLAEFVHNFFGFTHSMNLACYVMSALAPFMALVVVVGVSLLVWNFICWNWKKAGELAEK